MAGVEISIDVEEINGAIARLGKLGMATKTVMRGIGGVVLSDQRPDRRGKTSARRHALGTAFRLPTLRPRKRPAPSSSKVRTS